MVMKSLVLILPWINFSCWCLSLYRPFFVRPSVCPSVCLSVCRSVWLESVSVYYRHSLLISPGQKWGGGFHLEPVISLTFTERRSKRMITEVKWDVSKSKWKGRGWMQSGLTVREKESWNRCYKGKKEPDLPKKEKQYFVWYLSSRAWYHILLSFFITGSEIILHDYNFSTAPLG